MEKVNYCKFFNNIECKMIIFLEDDFSAISTVLDKKQLCYSLARMDKASRLSLISEIEGIEGIDGMFSQSLTSFSECIEPLFPLIVNWQNEVIEDDITSALEIIEKENIVAGEELNSIYQNIAIPDDDRIKELLIKYGLCITIPDNYSEIFSEYLRLENRWKAYRIYKKFDTENRNYFKDNLRTFYIANGANDSCLCCIVDNELSGDRRANEIIEEIKEFNSTERNSIIGAVVTSYESIEKIDEDIFFEYVNKSNVKTELQSALLKSTYNYAISKLKEEMVKGLDASFSKATTNRNIAFYLSQMAVYEGIANYQIINKWIQIMCDFELSKSNMLSYIIKLTNLISQLEIEGEEGAKDLKALNTFEAFDYNVNKFYQPPAAGDIFIDKNNDIYVLVGQDCDIMMSQTRRRKNAIAVLIPAKIVEPKEVFKCKNCLENMMINNFRSRLDDPASSKCLKIDYKSRVFLENELINLCTYNIDGKCLIDLEENLSEDSEKIMLPYLVDYYEELRKYFDAIKNLKNNANEAFDTFLNSNYNKRLISISDYAENGTELSYSFRRICRLNETYNLYLYKLYLEYRGRIPLNSINLAQCQSISVPVKDLHLELLVDVFLTGEPKSHSKFAQLIWEISRKDIINLLDILRAEAEPNVKDESFCLESVENIIPLNNGKKLNIKKFNKPEMTAKICN